MADLEKIVELVEESKALFESGEITQEEFAEILEDIKRTEAIEEMSDDVVLKAQILTVLSIATYLA